MILNNLKIAFRKLRRDKLHSIINITGLSIGLASCILIFLFVQDELKYDNFHKKSDRIYRLLITNKDESIRDATHALPFLPDIMDNLPEVEKAARVISAYKDRLIQHQDKKLKADLVYADSTFFDIFSFEHIRGSAEEALSTPMTAIITEGAAKRIYGDENPIGKNFQLENEHNLTIAGVMKDFPEQSHLQADMVVSFSSMKEINPYGYHSYNMTLTNIYFLLKPHSEITPLEHKIEKLYKEARPKAKGTPSFMLQPMKDIYLHSSDVRWDRIKKGDAEVVTGLSVVAILILVIACFNYMNLSTANYTREASNISVSKTLGATRSHLMWKYFSETLLMTFIAIWIAIILSELLMPFFNNFTEKNLQISLLTNKALILSLLFIFGITVLLGGTYPAVFLTSFQPLNIRKKSQMPSRLKGSGQSLWRKSFVIVQYMIAIVLIISTFIIYKQIQLITKEKTGFDKELVLAVKNPWDQNMTNRYNLFIEKTKNNPNIIAAGGSFNIPGERINNHGGIKIDGEYKYNAGHNVVSPGFFDVLNAKFVQGRNFKKELKTDSSCVILNQEAVKTLGLTNPIGDELAYGNFTTTPKRSLG